MSLTPQITLTATLEDITGVAAGSTGNPARLVIDLCGYGLTIPEIPATGTLAKIHLELLSTGAQISTPLWGNDVIVPGPDETYYAITVIDGDGNVVQTGNYRFDGTLTIDLSDATPIPIVPPAPPDPLPRVLAVTSTAGAATFDASLGSQVSLTFVITLSENVTATFLNLVAGTPYFLIVLEDATGGWTFTLPGNVLGGMFINTVALARSQQPFVGEANGAMCALSGGVTFP